MNIFYKQPIFLQWIEAISLAVIGFWPALIIIELGADFPLYYLLFPVYLPVGQFCFTPLLRLAGIYKYYSPMLLGYLPNQSQIDLHSGGSFDYLFVFAFGKNDHRPIGRQIMCFHLEGLLHLIQLVETGGVPGSVVISGTSYFFNERTARKLGFSTEEASLFYRINLYMNAIDLFWMYSVSQGRVALPNLGKAKMLKTTGNDLVRHKEDVQNYYRILSGTQAGEASRNQIA